MRLEAVHYEVDGRPFTGYLADGSGGGRVPGVLVAHEGAGLTDHVKGRARRLAQLGHVAFALDLFGEPEASLERKKEIVRALRDDRVALRRRGRVAFERLLAHPGVDAHRMAAIGYCFGGSAMLDLARDGVELACVVGFHAGLAMPPTDDAGAIRAKLLLCLGANDPVVTAEHRDAFAAEMSAAGVDWQMVLYGGAGHSFTNPEIDAWGFQGFAYHPVADQRSWRAMRDFLDEVLGPAAVKTGSR